MRGGPARATTTKKNELEHWLLMMMEVEEFCWPIILSVVVVLYTNTAGSYQETKHSQSSGGNFKKGVMKLLEFPKENY